MTINGHMLNRYFGTMQRRLDVLAPMYATSTLGTWDTYATVKGGGTTGQAQVLCLCQGALASAPKLFG